VSKQKAIGRIRTKGERDLSISDGALRLLLRLCSHIYTNPKASLEKPFPLPWSTVAVWCGLSDDKSASRRIAELEDAGYLKGDGLRGCPPIKHFYLIPPLTNCPSKGAIDCPEKRANKYPSRGANKYPSGGAHHKYNSLREEKIKTKSGELNGSLRSKVTTGNEMAASPTVLNEAQREQVARELRELQKNLKRS
jgi:hypothetical protein